MPIKIITLVDNGTNMPSRAAKQSYRFNSSNNKATQ